MSLHAFNKYTELKTTWIDLSGAPRPLTGTVRSCGVRLKR